MQMHKKLVTNKIAWDAVANQFFAHSALPEWGPFGIGKDLGLLKNIKNKTILEIGFGSGHSLNYLAKRGAKKVYGVDISEAQYAYATQINKQYIQKARVQLFLSPMEQKLVLPRVDLVVSIYALGWTIDPKKTLENIYSYLKPGGTFIWSWEHSLFSDVTDTGSGLVVSHAYHNEKELRKLNWKGKVPIYITYLKTDTWFKLLRGAGFVVEEYMEPVPKNSKFSSKNYYTLQKAKHIPATMIWVCKKPV